jgi:hypothetical protein
MSEMKSLEKIRKKNCLNEYYMDFINKQQTVKQLQISQPDCRALNIAESEKI